MNDKPLFSIITVCFNASHTIGRTLQSVASQSCTDYEHIIVDGASRDNTLDIVNESGRPELRRVLSEPDKGLYDAMNKGIGMARGKYLIFLNAGDKFHDAGSLASVARVIAENDFPGVVYGQTNLVDDNGAYLAPRHLTAPAKLTFKSFATGMKVCHQAFVALRAIAPLYDTAWRYSADYEWCIRCLMHSRKNVYTGGVLIDYLSEGMTTANRRRSLVERFKIMCRYYGTVPTAVRHVGFVPRFLINKLKTKPL